METSMLKRLEATKVRLGEVDQELSSENIMKDLAKFKALSKERANLEPVVECYEQYLKLESDLKDSEVMIADSDPEISAFGHEEHKRILEEEDQLVEKVKILLQKVLK